MVEPTATSPTASPRTPRVDLSKASSGFIPEEWPAQATDTIVGVIDSVRDKTTRPALVAARGVVYGLLAAIVGTVALVVLLIGLVRAVDNYAPGNIWIIYAVLAVLFSLGGVVLLRKANRPVPAT